MPHVRRHSMRLVSQLTVELLVVFLQIATLHPSQSLNASQLSPRHEKLPIADRLFENQNRPLYEEIGLLGIPVGCGQRKLGVEEGPTFLRAAGLVSRLTDLGHSVRDYGDVTVKDGPYVSSEKARRSYCVGSTSENARNAVANVLRSGSLSVNLGGDHTMSIGTVTGHAMTADYDISLLWVDAHSDVNTPLSTITGNIHGMPVAFLLHEMEPFLTKPEGMEWIKPCVRKSRFAYIALRDIDPYERYFMDKLGITLYSMEDVDRQGIHEIIRKVLRKINPEGTRSLHVSFDIDSIDPLIATSTGTPAIGGLSMREAQVIAEEVYRSGQLRVLDLAEVNPRLGTMEDAKRTVKCGVDIIASFFGHVRRGDLPTKLDPKIIEEKRNPELDDLFP